MGLILLGVALRYQRKGNESKQKPASMTLGAALVTFKGKAYDLGTYSTCKDAIKARMRGEKMHEDFLSRYYETHPEKCKSVVGK